MSFLSFFCDVFYLYMKRILKKSVIIDTNMIERLFFRNNFSISLQSIYLGKEGLFIEE